MKTGIELIAEERQRQITDEKWDLGHDDEHDQFELGRAAMCYEQHESERDLFKPGGVGKTYPKNWPWAKEWWKPTPENRIRELIKAGGLYRAEQERIERRINKIAAEIDRLNQK